MQFFDSSAVVKRYLHEAHSGDIRDWLSPGRSVVSRLAEVEVASAFARGVRTGILSTKQGERALAAFRADLRRWDVVELTPEVVLEANRLLWRHALRAADAIQLGTALVFERALDAPLDRFVAFDERLREAARTERLLVHPD